VQCNILNTGPWRIRAELHPVNTYWIEYNYNRRRRERGLCRLTLIEFELAVTSNVTHAAT
jgi:hypothetical protein